MNISIFDRYDIRTRIFALVFCLCPVILEAYILFDFIRNISSTVIVLISLLAYACLFICWIRYFGNRSQTADYIAEFLSPKSTAINKIALQRYYRIIAELEPSFSDLLQAEPNSELINELSNWLRQKTRGDRFKLVQEENINYGFIRNIYSVKKIFLASYAIYTLVLVLTLFFVNRDNIILSRYIACGFIHIITFMIWILCVTNKLLTFSAEKYALAVIHAIDELKADK